MLCGVRKGLVFKVLNLAYEVSFRVCVCMHAKLLQASPTLAGEFFTTNPPGKSVAAVISPNSLAK